MTLRRDSVTAALCGILAVGALLACKKKKEESTTSTTTPETPAATAATATATAAPASNKVYNVGDTATQIDYKLTVHNVKECKTQWYAKPKKGNLIIGAEVTVESQTDKSFFASSSNFKVTDGEGNAMSSSWASTRDCDQLKATNLNKGEKVKGWITFEVPSKASGLKMSYEHLNFLGPKQNVKFDLGR
jgi:hypothetical protein